MSEGQTSTVTTLAINGQAVPDEGYRDRDGTRLLFSDEFAAMATAQGRRMKTTTVRWHTADARKRRDEGRPAAFPEPDRYVQRTTRKANGQPVSVRAPMWREDRAQAWIDNPLGPGGRPVKSDEEETGDDT